MEESSRDGYHSLPPIAPQRQVTLDYHATGLSLKSHPVSFVRERLTAVGAVGSAALRDPVQTPEGEVCTVAGLVLVRQRPGTANDVTFITLEDETGIANLIVWRRIYQKYRRAAAARLLVATGAVQRRVRWCISLSRRSGAPMRRSANSKCRQGTSDEARCYAAQAQIPFN